MSITVGVKKFTVSTKMSPFLRESRFQNLRNFFWCNPEYRTSTPESLKRLDARTQVPLIKDPESRIWNPNSTAWNPLFPRLSCIPFQGVTDKGL